MSQRALMDKLDRVIYLLEQQLHQESDRAFEQTMARYNDMAAKAAADWHLNSSNQQSAFAAQLLKQSADMTGSNALNR